MEIIIIMVKMAGQLELSQRTVLSEVVVVAREVTRVESCGTTSRGQVAPGLSVRILPNCYECT